MIINTHMYHAPSKKGAAERIANEGFSFAEKPEETHQDYGPGIYLTSSKKRARQFLFPGEKVLRVHLSYDPEKLVAVVSEQREGFPFEVGRSVTAKALKLLEKRIPVNEVFADQGDVSYEGVEKLRAKALALSQYHGYWALYNSFPWPSTETFLEDFSEASGKQGMAVILARLDLSSIDLVVWDPRIISLIAVEEEEEE